MIEKTTPAATVLHVGAVWAHTLTGLLRVERRVQLDAELRDAATEYAYVTVPLADAHALEIERTDAGGYLLLERRWDRTHGLAAEVELGEAKSLMGVANLVVTHRVRIEAEWTRLEALLATEPADY